MEKLWRKWSERRRFRRDSRADVFSWIYSSNKWGSAASRSGKGSDLTNTERLREDLPRALAQLEIESILDLPCGDLNWMQGMDMSRYRYIGADIVPELIEANKVTFPEYEFTLLDVCESDLPAVDLLFCRDLLVHLCFADIELAVANIKRSKIRYLACTTFPNAAENRDKLTGNHRQLNMSAAPVNFGEPLAVIDDGPLDLSSHPVKKLGVWEIAYLPGAGGAAS